ncbi:MAG: non-hydrolyzing UDP-N-acetylglucosamine 2-epimerase [bacterium]
MKKIALLVSIRPNYIKIAKLMSLLKKEKEIKTFLINTGQHYDTNLSDIFFKQFNLRNPDYNLEIGKSNSHCEQISLMILRLEKVLKKIEPNMLILIGDSNAAVAGSLVGKRNNLKVAHIEAGLRCGIINKAEEQNRIITDHLSDYLFTPTIIENKNLINENIRKDRIYFCGNIMADALNMYLSKIKELQFSSKIGVKAKEFILLTIHRDSNVYTQKRVKEIFKAVNRISKFKRIIFPIHPKTEKILNGLNLMHLLKDVVLIGPQGYFEILSLINDSEYVITDSGGIQEETTLLNIPCFTIRVCTERPITISKGTNYLLDADSIKMVNSIERIMKKPKISKKISKWDGNTSERIIEIIKNKL